MWLLIESRRIPRAVHLVWSRCVLHARRWHSQESATILGVSERICCNHRSVWTVRMSMNHLVLSTALLELTFVHACTVCQKYGGHSVKGEYGHNQWTDAEVPTVVALIHIIPLWQITPGYPLYSGRRVSAGLKGILSTPPAGQCCTRGVTSPTLRPLSAILKGIVSAPPVG